MTRFLEAKNGYILDLKKIISVSSYVKSDVINSKYYIAYTSDRKITVYEEECATDLGFGDYAIYPREEFVKAWKSAQEERIPSGDKWGMFRNIMFNEMGITKETIKEWAKEAISEKIESMVKNHIIDLNDSKIEFLYREVLKDNLMRDRWGNVNLTGLAKEVKSEVIERLIKEIKK